MIVAIKAKNESTPNLQRGLSQLTTLFNGFSKFGSLLFTKIPSIWNNKSFSGYLGSDGRPYLWDDPDLSAHLKKDIGLYNTHITTRRQ